MIDNIEKINFEYLGKYRGDYNTFGHRGVAVFKCPVCRSETTFYRRKGVLKIKCDLCSYENITSITQWVLNSISFNELTKAIKDFFELVEKDIRKRGKEMKKSRAGE